jgi:hypothetical protein
MSEHLLSAIVDAVESLEHDNEIVVASSSSGRAASRIYNSVLNAVPNANLTPDEGAAVKSLILHAINDSRFFDWEMPTLTGGTADDFRRIVDKLTPKP